MVGRDDEHAAFLDHDAAADSGRRPVEARDGQIGLALQQLAHRSVAVAAGTHGELDAALPLPHRACEQAHHGLRGRPGEAEPDPPAAAAVRGFDIGSRPLPQPQDPRGRVQQRPAGGGQFDAARGAVEELRAQVRFQCADGAAEVGLGEVQARGGAAEVQLLRHRAEDLQLDEVHREIISPAETITALLVLDTHQKGVENQDP